MFWYGKQGKYCLNDKENATSKHGPFPNEEICAQWQVPDRHTAENDIYLFMRKHGVIS